MTRHGRNPDAIPPAMQTPSTNGNWVSIAERLPELPATATEVRVDVRHIIDDEVVESSARFVNEQSSLNPVGAPCFVLLGRRIDVLNLHGFFVVAAAGHEHIADAAYGPDAVRGARSGECGRDGQLYCARSDCGRADEAQFGPSARVAMESTMRRQCVATPLKWDRHWAS